MFAEKFDSQPNEQILAVRFKPNARILDLRGIWADLLSKQLDLPKWSVGQNRADVFNEKEDRRVFVGFSDYGVQLQNTSKRNFFPEYAGKFLKLLSDLDEFRDPMSVMRIGVRSSFCTPVTASFASLSNLVQERYVTLQTPAIKAMGEGVKILDVGAPFNFEDKLGSFNTHCGPMNSGQLKQFFSFARKDDLPSCGLYFDIDYFKQPKEVIKIGSVADLVSEFAVEAWEKHLRVRDLILGGT